MYYKLKKDKLDEIFAKAIDKFESVKNVIVKLRIIKSNFYLYKSGTRAIPDKILEELLRLSEVKIEKKDILEKLPDNWKQIIGGKSCTKIKRENGTLNKQLEIARTKIPYKKSTKAWHIKMKKENPDLYHKIQYERFKKVGGYKFTTKKGEKVRNKLEKDAADLLFENGVSYLYEPMVKVNEKYFFPDLLINDKFIVECTMWRGYDKAIKLKDKIKYLNRKYKVYVLIPNRLFPFYKSIKNNIIFDLKPLIATFK